MKVAAFSQKSGEWFRTGNDIEYRKTTTVGENKKQYYTLSFTHTFDSVGDTIYFAYSYPYTYTDLKTFLTDLSLNKKYRNILQKNVLCRTISGYECEILTITSPNFPTKTNTIIPNKKLKKGVIFTARVHPGETVSSWMLQGVIEFLLSDDLIAQKLRENYVFKIIPMLNIDGVIQGNYRCSLIGCDLNRRYLESDKVIFL